MEYDEESIQTLILVGLVHNIGCDQMPEQLLERTTTLTEEEFIHICKYIRYGYEVLEVLQKGVLSQLLCGNLCCTKYRRSR